MANKISEKKSELGITVKKNENFSEWYTQLIQKADLIEYTDVSGCIVYKPASYYIWEKIQEFMNKIINERGVRNTYFPIFIPEKLLVKESSHVEGFTPEVAWVTHGGKSKLNEKLAVRPTSETVMYDAYSKWIRSHRDLPLLINQWNNVIRWEFKNPMPFIRGREFLWQEGHNVFATKQECAKDVREILVDLYSRTQRDLLAFPGLLGTKTKSETFAGADYSESVENYCPNGKAIQGCTSHMLGQNFSKVFDISFLDENGDKKFGWQNSWGFSTRVIGIMIMVHGDDKGLVLPPKVAYNKAVIVPILFEDSKKKVMDLCHDLKKDLKEFNVFIDDREEYTPGHKFNEWELKGIPLRIELGPKDLEKKQVVVVKRNTGEKIFVKIKDLKKEFKKLLDDIQIEMLKAAEKKLFDNIVEVDSMDRFKKAIKDKKLVLAPFCDTKDCEENIKSQFEGVKSLNKPFDQKAFDGSVKCVNCSKSAEVMCYFGKSY